MVLSQAPPGNSHLFSIFVEKGWWFVGQAVLLLMNEDFGPHTVLHLSYTAVWVGQCREVELTYKA